METNASARNRPVYLDYQATTPTDPRVLAAMLPWFTERFGNPHSASHAMGREAAEAIETARGRIATVIGADPREIVFTSGATESNNLAIKGAMGFLRRHLAKNHVITLASEHKCVLESAAFLEAAGCRVSVLPVMANGLVDLALLEMAIVEDTGLVSVMAVNNEIGVIQSIAAIGALCRARGVLFHTDAAQAFGKIPLDVEAMAIDLSSISGHKIYGPKGIGALYVRRRPRVRLEAEMSGGGQERGLRSGTLPTPLCVGLGEAAAIAAAEMDAEGLRIRRLRDRLWAGLRTRLPTIRLNGDEGARIPGNLNFAIPGVDAEALMAQLPDLCFSTGSACTSAAVEPSYVLKSLGLGEGLARASIRLGLGRFTTAEEIDYSIERLAAAARVLAPAQASEGLAAAGPGHRDPLTGRAPCA